MPSLRRTQVGTVSLPPAFPPLRRNLFSHLHFRATVTSNGSPYAMGSLSCLSVCNAGVLWPNGWMDQDDTWYGGRPRPRRHCVRWGPSSPTERGTVAAPPLFGYVYCGQTVAHLSNCWALVFFSTNRTHPWPKRNIFLLWLWTLTYDLGLWKWHKDELACHTSKSSSSSNVVVRAQRHTDTHRTERSASTTKQLGDLAEQYSLLAEHWWFYAAS